MPGRSRPRLERALTKGSGEATDALAALREAFPELMTGWIESAKNKPEMASNLLRLMESDIRRAQTTQADSLLQRILAIRGTGSPILTLIWNQSARAISMANMELVTSQPLIPDDELDEDALWARKDAAWERNLGANGLPRGVRPSLRPRASN